ncbi:hypothetical protein [Halomonas dongshanensis]|uniref:Uncharacterized protein n=1 Tax=Halomonas dongshanensis TaxID=2890835 RepID=A0ABT2EFE4_9GAMM|nr:hypothetical protein [Halomonas dongshanensis]MCS2609334.1 hypothetical protein [Halomonas dongshanensis]
MTSSPNLFLKQVSTAHLVSHLHIMILPALLPLLPDTMQVGFVELSFTIGLFTVVCALVQVPLGYSSPRLMAQSI